MTGEEPSIPAEVAAMVGNVVTRRTAVVDGKKFQQWAGGSGDR